MCHFSVCVFFFKQKTAYEMRISDWSSDVCSSDLFGTSIAPAEVGMACLGELPLALPGRQHGLRQVVEREADRAGLTLSVQCEVDSIDVMLDLVARGTVCTLLPVSAVASRAEAGALTLGRLGQRGGLHRTMSVVRNPAIALTHASVRIETLLRTVLSQLAAAGTWSGRLLDD